MLDDGHAGLHLDLGIVVDRAAKEGREIAVRRERRGRIEARRSARQALRGIAAIGEAEVVVEFVAQLDLGIVGRLQRHRRIDAVALEMAVVAEGIAAFVDGVEAHRDVLVDRLTGIQRDAPVVPGAGLCRRLVDPGAVGFLERAVDQTAAGAAAEDQRARPLQHLDALRVVEVAEILDVVAKTVDEEIGAGIDAANDEFVTIALALMDGDARNVARHLGDGSESSGPG